MTTCPRCAAPMIDGASACPQCGAGLDAGAATTTELAAAPPGAGPSAQPTQPVAPMPTPMTAPPPAAAPPGPSWWMAADGRWYPPQAPPAVPMPGPAWVQGPDGQWYQAPAAQPVATYPYGYGYLYEPPKSKAVAAVLAFCVGSTGAHNFYLGRTNTAVTQLCMLIVGFITSLFIVGIFVLIALSIWVFVEFILILTGGIQDGQNRPLA